MRIERVLTRLEVRNHQNLSRLITTFLIDCLNRLGLPRLPEDDQVELRDLLFLLMSLRATRSELALELEGGGQQVALRLAYDHSGPEPKDELVLPELASGAGPVQLTFYLTPPYASFPDLVRRVDNLRSRLPLLEVLLKTEPPRDSTPVLLRPLTELQEALRSLGWDLSAEGRQNLEADLRQWQREEAFREFQLAAGPHRALQGAAIPDLGQYELCIGIVLVEPFSPRPGWTPDPLPIDPLVSEPAVPRRRLLWNHPCHRATQTRANTYESEAETP